MPWKSLNRKCLKLFPFRYAVAFYLAFRIYNGKHVPIEEHNTQSLYQIVRTKFQAFHVLTKRRKYLILKSGYYEHILATLICHSIKWITNLTRHNIAFQNLKESTIFSAHDGIQFIENEGNGNNRIFMGAINAFIDFTTSLVFRLKIVFLFPLFSFHCFSGFSSAALSIEWWALSIEHISILLWKCESTRSDKRF